MTALSGEILLRLLQRHVRLGEIHHAADSVVDDGRKIVGELVLQHEAEAIDVYKRQVGCSPCSSHRSETGTLSKRWRRRMATFSSAV